MFLPSPQRTTHRKQHLKRRLPAAAEVAPAPVEAEKVEAGEPAAAAQKE